MHWVIGPGTSGSLHTTRRSSKGALWIGGEQDDVDEGKAYTPR